MGNTRDFAEVIRKKLASQPELAASVEDEFVNADIGSQIHDLRREAGLTQTELAEMIGSHQSVIARMEDADYDGHSLPMLKKIATALNKRLRVEFCSCFHPPVSGEINRVETFEVNLGNPWKPSVREVKTVSEKKAAKA